MNARISKGFYFFAGAILSVLVISLLGADQNDPPLEPVPDTSEADTTPCCEEPSDGKLRIICFGAHPDDCELKAAGVAAKWAAQGHHVKFVSLTNGDVGHWQMAGGPLAKRRTAEVEKCAKILGIETEVLDIHDGELMPTLENRQKVTRLIREWKADVVLCHRPNDYHPDHRNTGLLVQDAAYMVTVPFFCTDAPYLVRNPVFLYLEDRFAKPNPFSGDIVVAIDDVVDKKIECVHALASQFYEGGCCSGISELPDEPQEKNARRQEVQQGFDRRFAATADRFRDKLAEAYGEAAARDIHYAEAFEVCEYGRQPSPEEIKELFPFFEAP
jgi:LmbE family N-acetylglucosaminyl deacetylase